MKWALGGAALVALGVTLNGCGGEAAFGQNMNVLVDLEEIRSGDIGDLDMIIVPRRGLPEAPKACGLNEPDKWCSPEAARDMIRFRYSTSSRDEPYYVYVVNTSNRAIDAKLRVRMNNELKLTRNMTVLPGSTAHQATIFRNSVEQ